MMLEILQNKITTFFSRLKVIPDQRPTETVAVYVGSNRVYLCNASKDNVNCSSLAIPINPTNSLEPRLISALTPLRNQFDPLRPIQLILTLPCDSPELSKGFLQKAATQLQCTLFTLDFRMCCAMGIGLNVSASSKHLVVIAADKTFHVFITF